MMSAVYCLTLLLGVFSVSATDIRLNVTNVNGLQATVSPDLASIGVNRKLPVSQSPSPTVTVMPRVQQNTSSPASTGVQSSATPIPRNNASTSAPPNNASSSSFAGRIDVSLVSIRELDGNMTAVQTASPRSFNAFSSLGLGFVGSLPPPVTVLVPVSTPIVTANCQTVMNSVLYPAPLNTTTFNITACAMTENTTVLYGNEVNQINAGQLGVSLMISSWPWTSSGAYIELNVTVAVPTGRKPSLTSRSSVEATKIGLGTSDAYALFSARIANNMNPDPRSYLRMPADFPKLIPSGGGANSNATIVLMLPRTTTLTIIWNLVVEPGYGYVSIQSATERVIPSFIVQTFALLLVVILAE